MPEMLSELFNEKKKAVEDKRAELQLAEQELTAIAQSEMTTLVNYAKSLGMTLVPVASPRGYKSRRTIFTPAALAQAKQMRQQGQSLGQIAKHFGTSYMAVKYHNDLGRL